MSRVVNGGWVESGKEAVMQLHNATFCVSDFWVENIRVGWMKKKFDQWSRLGAKNLANISRRGSCHCSLFTRNNSLWCCVVF